MKFKDIEVGKEYAVRTPVNGVLRCKVVGLFSGETGNIVSVSNNLYDDGFTVSSRDILGISPRDVYGPADDYFGGIEEDSLVTVVLPDSLDHTGTVWKILGNSRGPKAYFVQTASGSHCCAPPDVSTNVQIAVDEGKNIYIAGTDGPRSEFGRGAEFWGQTDYVLWDRGKMVIPKGYLTPGGVREPQAHYFVRTGIALLFGSEVPK